MPQTPTPSPSPSPRFPAPGSGGLEPQNLFYPEEIALALRNRGLPLEAMRHPLTPTGLHYLLIHFDIPAVAPDHWRLEIGGLVSRPLSLSLPDLMARPAVATPVTLECAGNGRALLSPRPLSQPWLHEAIGTARWTGAPLRPLLDEAGLYPDAAELVFTGLDEGVQGDQRQCYQRSLAISQITDDILLAWAMNDEPVPPQHGYPLRLVVPGWYGMASVKWLHRIDAIAGHFDGYQMERTYRYSHGPDDPGDPVTHIRVRSLMIPPRHTRLYDPPPPGGRRRNPDYRTRLGRPGHGHAGRIQPRRRRHLDRRPTSAPRRPLGLARMAMPLDGPARPPYPPRPRHRRPRQYPARNPALDSTGNGQQYGPARPRPRRITDRIARPNPLPPPRQPPSRNARNP